MKIRRLHRGALFCRRPIPGGTVSYRLKRDRADGRARYTLSVRRRTRDGNADCVLPDCALSGGTAARLFLLFARRRVLPEEAPFVYDDLCAAGGDNALRDPTK